MIYAWRKMLDEYRDNHETDSKILLTEAYASLADTMRFYESADGQQGAHMPFNFGLIYINAQATAQSIKEDINRWLDYMPDHHTPNWVVMLKHYLHAHLNTIIYLSYNIIFQ